MKRKMFYCVLITLFAVVGCKGASKEYTCEKKVPRNSNSNYASDTKIIAKLDGNKLSDYIVTTTYTFDSKKVCEESCETSSKWNSDVEENTYPGIHRKTTCNCKKYKMTETDEYDINALDNNLRKDIKYLSKDDSFKLDEWMKYYKNEGYKCQK